MYLLFTIARNTCIFAQKNIIMLEDNFKRAMGKKFKAVREKEKLTQTIFAGYFNIQRANYSLIETGKIFPSLKFIKDCVNKFNLCYDYFFDETINLE